MAVSVRADVVRHNWLAPVLVAALLVIGAVVAIGVIGTSGADGTNGTTTHDVTAYPREVRVADVPDVAIRGALSATNPEAKVLVELAPGVYALRGDGPLGRVEDYTAVFGNCADVSRFLPRHRVARSC